MRRSKDDGAAHLFLLEQNMPESYCWSASVGRWLGIPVRVHVTLFLFVAFIFGLETQVQGSGVMFTALATTAILLASLLLHELAHAFALTNLGGSVNSIVLAPWGGLSDFSMPTGKRSRAIIELSGVFANLMVVLFGMALLVQTGKISGWELINPFSPHVFRTADWEISLITIATWINFQLFVVNLIPAFPFDGARLLRLLVSVLNPDLSRVRCETSIMVFAHAIAFTMIGSAWFLRSYQDGPIEPVWLLLVLSGIVVLFAARYSFIQQMLDEGEDWDELEDFEYDSMYDENSFFDLPEDESNGYSQWLSEKQEARRREEIRIEHEEELRADDILKKLHSEGIESLSEDDRALLNRVSDRLRQKRVESQ